MRQTIPVPIITAIASPMMMGSSFPPVMTFLRIFDPVGVAPTPHVEPSQELRASRTEHAIVILLMSFSSCFVDSHSLIDYPFGEIFVVCMKGPSEVVQRALLERGVSGCEDVEHVVHHGLGQPDVNREVLEKVVAPDIIYHVEAIVPDEELVADGARYSGQSPGCCPGVLRLEDHDHCSSGVRVVPESHDDIIQLVYFGALVENVQTLRIGVVEATLLTSLAHQLLPQVPADLPALTRVDSVSVKPVGELCSAILLDELGLVFEHEIEHLTFAEIRLRDDKAHSDEFLGEPVVPAEFLVLVMVYRDRDAGNLELPIHLPDHFEAVFKYPCHFLFVLRVHNIFYFHRIHRLFLGWNILPSGKSHICFDQHSCLG